MECTSRRPGLIANNTYLLDWREIHVFAIKHHYTVIVKFHLNGDIELFNGGWYSSTTKRRLNSCLYQTKFNIVQEDYKWYVENCYSHRYETRREIKYPFHEGVTITYDDRILPECNKPR